MQTFSSIYLKNIILVIMTQKTDQLLTTLLNGNLKLLQLVLWNCGAAEE